MTSLPAAADLVRNLGLLPHPEGGFYRETYRATTQVGDGRPAATMIYFLLPAGHVSRLHRIDADEGWHHYLGGALEIFELGRREALLARFPAAADLVTRLTAVTART
jgi:uncharacterized protein